MLAAWRQLRQQIVAFHKAVRALAKRSPVCRLLMSVPGIGVLSVLAYVSMIEDPMRFARSRSVGAYLSDRSLTRVSSTTAASYRSVRASLSPHLDILPLRSIS